MLEPKPKDPDDGAAGVKPDAESEAKPADKPEGKPGEKQDWIEKE